MSFSAPIRRDEAAEQLRSQGILEETLVLSTCNRSEALRCARATRRPMSLPERSSSFLRNFHSSVTGRIEPSLYRHHYDPCRGRHLFRVAAGLDSMLLGEAEILGQFETLTWGRSRARPATGPVLNRLFQGALEIGKRVRAETELGTQAGGQSRFSRSQAAERIFGKLNEPSRTGLGRRARPANRWCAISAIEDQAICPVLNRSRETCRTSLAARFGGEGDHLGKAWARPSNWPDLIVTSLSGPGAHCYASR